MKKYFELKENNQLFIGVIENIPDSKVSLEDIKNRIETNSNNQSIKLIDDEYDEVDIIMDWMSIDYEQGFDKEFVYIDEKLDIAREYDIETEVVFGALKYMKKKPEVTISEAIEYAMGLSFSNINFKKL